MTKTNNHRLKLLRNPRPVQFQNPRPKKFQYWVPTTTKFEA